MVTFFKDFLLLFGQLCYVVTVAELVTSAIKRKELNAKRFYIFCCAGILSLSIQSLI